MAGAVVMAHVIIHLVPIQTIISIQKSKKQTKAPAMHGFIWKIGVGGLKRRVGG